MSIEIEIDVETVATDGLSEIDNVATHAGDQYRSSVIGILQDLVNTFQLMGTYSEEDFEQAGQEIWSESFDAFSDDRKELEDAGRQALSALRSRFDELIQERKNEENEDD